MSMHNRQRNMVVRLLGVGRGGQGVSVKFVKRTPGKYDPATGGTTPETITEFEGSGVRVNYSEWAYRDTTIIHGDFQVYLSPVLLDGQETPTPKQGDIIHFLEDKVKVIRVSPFNENGVGCGWKLQVRYG